MDADFNKLFSEKNMKSIKEFVDGFDEKGLNPCAAEDAIFENSNDIKKIRIESRRLRAYFDDNLAQYYRYVSYMQEIEHDISLMKFDSSVPKNLKMKIALLDVEVGLTPFLLSALPDILEQCEKKYRQEGATRCFKK